MTESVPLGPPPRGKDLPLKALEAVLDHAKDEVARAEGALRAAYSQAQAADRALALARRDAQDITRSIVAVRALETEPLAEYTKAVRAEAVTSQ